MPARDPDLPSLSPSIDVGSLLVKRQLEDTPRHSQTRGRVPRPRASARTRDLLGRYALAKHAAVEIDDSPSLGIRFTGETVVIAKSSLVRR
jgi:hypothetical protein